MFGAGPSALVAAGIGLAALFWRLRLVRELPSGLDDSILDRLDVLLGFKIGSLADDCHANIASWGMKFCGILFRLARAQSWFLVAHSPAFVV